MFAEPTLSPHSLGQITITISTLHESRIQGLNIVHPHPESQLLPPRTPVQEGPQLPLRPARRSQNIFDSATSTRAATKLPLSPNNTPIEVEKLACIPDHTQIYQHYFHSAPVNALPSQPSTSPQVISQTVAEDPFTRPPAVSHLAANDQVLLLPDKDLKIEVPRGDLGQAEIRTLLQMAAKLVSESLTATTSENEKDIFRSGYRKGLRAAAIIFKSQPGIPKFIAKVLENAEKSSQPEHDPPLDMPRFVDTSKYIDSLRGTSRRRVLGKMDGVDVFVSVIGRVETYDYDQEDDDFYGKCIVRLGDHEIQGYCLGSIGTSGTGIIICKDESLIAFSPPKAVDLEWPPMKGAIGAIVKIKPNGDIILEHMPNLEVESLAVW